MMSLENTNDNAWSDAAEASSEREREDRRAVVTIAGVETTLGDDEHTEHRLVSDPIDDGRVISLFREAEEMRAKADAIEAELKEQAKDDRARAKVLRSDAKKLAEQARAGTEAKDVEVAVRRTATELYVLRCDTGAEIERRALTGAERQTSLKLVPGGSDETVHVESETKKSGVIRRGKKG